MRSRAKARSSSAKMTLVQNPLFCDVYDLFCDVYDCMLKQDECSVASLALVVVTFMRQFDMFWTGAMFYVVSRLSVGFTATSREDVALLAVTGTSWLASLSPARQNSDCAL
jgi:hypothetical protein